MDSSGLSSSEELKSLSPALFHRLAREFAEDSEEFLCFADAFETAIRCGGLEEIDFQRAPEVSFNPRPARVAIILMTDVAHSDRLSWISAILLSSSLPSMRVPNSVLRVFPQLLDVLPLGWEDPRDILRQVSLSPESHSLRSLAWAALSNHLDRIRQLHRASPTRIAEVLPDIQTRHASFSSLSHVLAPTLEKKFSQWEERVLPRLLKDSGPLEPELEES